MSNELIFDDKGGASQNVNNPNMYCIVKFTNKATGYKREYTVNFTLKAANIAPTIANFPKVMTIVTDTA